MILVNRKGTGPLVTRGQTLMAVSLYSVRGCANIEEFTDYQGLKEAEEGACRLIESTCRVKIG
jgi:hypothetical protein